MRLLERCPVSGPPIPDGPAPALGPAVGAALAPVVVGVAVSAVRDYLDRVQKEQTASYVAMGAGELPKSGKPFCLLVARGRIGEASDSELPSQGSLKTEDMKRVGLAAPPAFYMEAHVQVTPRSVPDAAAQGQDAQAKPPAANLTVSPQFVQFARTAAKRGKDDEKTVAMILVLRATPAPENATVTTAGTNADAVFPLNFGKLKPGVEIRSKADSDADKQAKMKPGVEIRPKTDSDADKQAKMKHPLSDLEQTTTLQQVPVYLNAYAFVTETAEPDRVVALISKTLERQADGLEKALSTAIQDAIKNTTPQAGGK